MVIYQLHRQPTIAFDQRFPDDLGNLVYFILLLRQLLFQLLNPRVHLFKFLEGGFIKHFPFSYPFRN